MIEVTKYACSDWLITPAALAANQSPPADMREQKFLLVLCGVCFFELHGHDFERDLGNYAREVALIRPDLDPALSHAVATFQIPTPAGGSGQTYTRHFQVEQFAGGAGLASISNYSRADYNGWACDEWRAAYEDRTDAVTAAPLGKLFAGMEVDLAVRNYEVRIHRLNYHITLLGKVTFAGIVIT